MLVAIFTKIIVSLSQGLQRVLLHIHQYSIRILYKPWPQLFIVDWMSRNHHQMNRSEEIPGMNITIDAIESCIDIPDCMTAEEIKSATIDDEHQTCYENIYFMAGHQ